jgi:hypothetical protein
MTRTRTALLCLFAVGALSAAGAAPALALPEFTGPFPKAFTSTSKTTVMETAGTKKVVKCTADTNVGEITGPTSGLLTIRFTGCTQGTIPCNSSGAAAGEIVTLGLVARLGYINRELKEVGVELSNPAGALITEFACGAASSFVLRGGVIGKITPVNKLVKPPARFNLKFTQKAGLQVIKNFAGEPPTFWEASLNGGPFEPDGITSTDLLSFTAPTMIVA